MSKIINKETSVDNVEDMKRKKETDENMPTNKWKKLISLILLVIQSSSLILYIRYSRSNGSEEKYLISVAVVVAELMKMAICGVLVIYQNNYDINRVKYLLLGEGNVNDVFLLAIPAALYTLQNNLLFWALDKIDAATYQITYQLKILTTALFTVYILHRTISKQRWLSLLILTMGVAMVQVNQVLSKSSIEEHEVVHHSLFQQLIGFSCIIAACFTSGFAGVFFEKILKNSNPSVWIRNVQLAFFSFIIGTFGAVFYDFNVIMKHGPLFGFNSTVWIIVTLQAAGGLIIAAVIKYADNILKGFANALSIIFSCTASYLILNEFTPTKLFFAGAFLVISSTLLYMYERRLVLPRTNVK
ncbi:hypothetical protein SNEBB_000991 [Seison nebaliae]|nr:hypothetical protein SNEBB_000991 [Seison nebaliae]